MTLYDELVKLFREHRVYTASECGCRFDLGANLSVAQLHDAHEAHLATLACERAEQVIEGVTLSSMTSYALDEPPVVETHRLPEPWKRELIAALGEVKR